MNLLLKAILPLSTAPAKANRDRSSHPRSHARLGRLSNDTAVAWIARILVVASVLCTVWWFGGVDPAPKVVAGVLLLGALALTVVRVIAFPPQPSNAPWLALSVIAAWLGWAYVQTWSLPAGILSFIAPGVAATTARFRDSSELLSSAASISLVPELTFRTLAWQVMVGVAFLLSALLFDSKRSRLALLIVVASNAVILACWGIIQRSTGTTNLLPGITNPISGSNPFGSFIYKNSGGAAMVLGIAAIACLMTQRIGLLLSRMQTRKSSGHRIRSSGISDEHYDDHASLIELFFSRKKIDLALSTLTDPLVILIGFGLALAFAGIASALSRGACIGVAAGGAIFVAGFLAKTRAIGSAIALVSITLVSAMLLVVLFENNQKVMVRVEMLDGEVIRNDDRWNHWPAAIQSLQTYFPTGAGLGTYGFASLPFQENSYDGWYKQAHNQYLETAVESGLPGIVLALSILVLFATWIVRLLLSQSSPERFAWGALVCIAAVGTAVQAVGDFVITTPANALTFAVLMGAAASLAPRRFGGPQPNSQLSQPNTQLSQPSTQPAKPNAISHPLTWCIFALPIALLSQRILAREMVVDRLLAKTELPDDSGAPTADSCRENLNVFAQLSHPMSEDSRIQRRMGAWNELLYRAITLQSIIAETGRPATVELWNATQLSTIFGMLMAIPDGQSRNEARETYMGSDAARAALQSANRHYIQSIAANPLLTQVQLIKVAMAPLLGEAYLKRLESARRLSGVSSELLFSVGVLANFAGDVQIMNEAWSRSLQIDSRRLPVITELALTRESEEHVIRDLYPDRSTVLISASRRSDLPLSTEARAAALERASSALDSDENTEQLTQVERIQLRASIAEMESKWSRAAELYAELVRLIPREAGIRFRYARLLLQLGDTKNAWTQVNTGATLSPADPQSIGLFQQIDQVRKTKR